MKNASIGLFRCQRIFSWYVSQSLIQANWSKKKGTKKKRGKIQVQSSEHELLTLRGMLYDWGSARLRVAGFIYKKKKLCTPIGHEIEFEAFVKLTGNELCSIRRLILTCRSATTFHKSTMSPSFFASIADTASSVQVLQRSSCVMPDSETKSQS